MFDQLFKELVKTTVKEAFHELAQSELVKNLVVNVLATTGKTDSDVGTASTTTLEKRGKGTKPSKTSGETSGPVADQSEAVTPSAKDTQPSIATDRAPSSEAPAVDAATLRADSLAIIDQLAPTHGRELRAALAKFSAKRLAEVADSDLPAFFADLEALKNAQ